MLLTRQEMSFDFQGARLDPTGDRALLRFIFSQFLYGEVTGIQVGHWLYDAPDLEAARFLARQALEEMQHVGNFVRIFHMLDLEPEPAHPVVRFLATGMMGTSWAQHVATEMALGEGFVLSAMYGVMDTLNHPPVVEILERASRQEAKHVEFGEERTMKLIADNLPLRRRLLGFGLVWLWGVQQLGEFMAKKLDRSHPVLGQLPQFTQHTLTTAQLRMVRMGLSECPPLELSRVQQLRLVGEAFGNQVGQRLRSLGAGPLSALGLTRTQRLTERYLKDPALRMGAIAHHRMP